MKFVVKLIVIAGKAVIAVALGLSVIPVVAPL
jgi:hypothetical protein